VTAGAASGPGRFKALVLALGPMFKFVVFSSESLTDAAASESPASHLRRGRLATVASPLRRNEGPSPR
jgi:hypothetical protein